MYALLKPEKAAKGELRVGRSKEQMQQIENSYQGGRF